MTPNGPRRPFGAAVPSARAAAVVNLIAVTRARTKQGRIGRLGWFIHRLGFPDADAVCPDQPPRHWKGSPRDLVFGVLRAVLRDHPDREQEFLAACHEFDPRLTLESQAFDTPRS